MRYYIEIHDYHFKGERVAGSLETEEPLKQKEFIEAVQEFAVENKICPSYAGEHLFVKKNDFPPIIKL